MRFAFTKNRVGPVFTYTHERKETSRFNVTVQACQAAVTRDDRPLFFPNGFCFWQQKSGLRRGFRRRDQGVRQGGDNLAEVARGERTAEGKLNLNNVITSNKSVVEPVKRCCSGASAHSIAMGVSNVGRTIIAGFSPRASRGIFYNDTADLHLNVICYSMYISRAITTTLSPRRRSRVPRGFKP